MTTKLPVVAGERNVYLQFGDEAGGGSNIEGSLLRFTKDGSWVHGQDQEEIPEGTPLIAGIDTIKLGWIKWVDNKPEKTLMGYLNEGFRVADRSELGDLDEDEWEDTPDGKGKRDPWQETYSMLLRDPETGDIYTFSTSSKSGKSALGQLAKAYGIRCQEGEDPELMPIVTLQSDSYKHKLYGKTWVPVFQIDEETEWVKPPAEEKKPAPVVKAKKPVAAAAKKAVNGKGPAKAATKALPPPSRGQTRQGPSRRV